MTRPAPRLHDKVLRNLAAKGEAGVAWLAALPGEIGRLERAWGIAVGQTFPNATEAYVAEAVLADGSPAAIKIPIPGVEKAQREIEVLRAAGGHGFVRLLRSDPSTGAMLQERLGRQLARLGLTAEAEIEAVCATLQQAWIRPPAGLQLMTGAEKARSMEDVIRSVRARYRGACSERAAAVALRFTEQRREAFEPATSVLGHGDAHAWNTLEDPKSGGFKFVDPEGLFIERAHDLSISLREGVNDFLAGDPLERGRSRCAFLARLTGTDNRAIWQWGLIECLVNGLLYVDVGTPEHGAPFLAIAEAWAAAEPG